MFHRTKRNLTASGIMCLMLMAAGQTAYGAAPAPQVSTVWAQEVPEPGGGSYFGRAF